MITKNQQLVGNIIVALATFFLIALVSINFNGEAIDFGYFQVSINFNYAVLAELLVAAILIPVLVRLLFNYPGIGPQIFSRLFYSAENLTESLISIPARNTTPPPKAA